MASGSWCCGVAERAGASPTIRAHQLTVRASAHDATRALDALRPAIRSGLVSTLQAPRPGQSGLPTRTIDRARGLDALGSVKSARSSSAWRRPPAARHRIACAARAERLDAAFPQTRERGARGRMLLGDRQALDPRTWRRCAMRGLRTRGDQRLNVAMALAAALVVLRRLRLPPLLQLAIVSVGSPDLAARRPAASVLRALLAAATLEAAARSAGKGTRSTRWCCSRWRSSVGTGSLFDPGCS